VTAAAVGGDLAAALAPVAGGRWDEVATAVRAAVADKLAVAHPGHEIDHDPA
jgi:hypothetical protein